MTFNKSFIKASSSTAALLEAISKLPSYILNYHILLSAIIEQAQ